MRIVAATSLAALTVVTAGAASRSAVVPGASMSVPRAAHTATLLPTGEVLIAGGCTVSGCELDRNGATAELYDPARDRFTKTGSMRAPRVGHSATLLRTGSVLVAGGWHEEAQTATAELYDPASGVFSRTGSLAAPRGAFTASLLPDGKVLIAGGARAGRSIRTAELYDPATGSFQATGAMRTARSAHAAALLPGGRVLVVGGMGERGRVLAGAEIYDAKTGKWTTVGRLRVARHKHAAAALREGRVLVLGGSDARDFRGRHASAELYDPRRRRFVAVRPLVARRFKLPDAVAALPSGAILVAGGSRTVELFDPRRRAFRVVGRVSADLAFSTATTLRDGRVLVAGGYDDQIAVTKRAWLFRS